MATSNKWLAIGLIGISAILAIIKPATMPLWYFFIAVILPIIGWFGLVSWHIRSRESWLAMLATVVYFFALLYLLLVVFAIEVFYYYDNY